MSFKVIDHRLMMVQYEGFNDFVEDLKQIYKNTSVFNGPTHFITQRAKMMMDKAMKFAREKMPFIKEKDPSADLKFLLVTDEPAELTPHEAP
eukprot:UN14271